MVRISFSDGLAVAGGILAIVLVVLDKAGKLKGPTLFILLGVAAAMAIPLALGNSWVSDANSTPIRVFRSLLLICLVGAFYSAVSLWISTGEGESVAEGSKVSQDPWHLAIETVIAGGARGLKTPDPFDPTTISGIWIVYQGSYGNSASPASIALFMRITNTQNVDRTVESITYEALGLNTGKWSKLTRLPLITSQACYGFGDLKGAAMLDFSKNGLAVQSSNRPIKPNESVRGWDLLEYPDGFALSGTPMRCTVKDILGHEFSTVVPFPSKDDEGSNVMTRGLVLTGVRPDFSGYHRDYWSNMHAH